MHLTTITILITIATMTTALQHVSSSDPIKLRPQQIPYVTLYENENFRGTTYTLQLTKTCINLPGNLQNWTSSLNTHRRCLDVCYQLNCIRNTCTRFEPNASAQSRLVKYGLNDRVKSLKSCYVL